MSPQLTSSVSVAALIAGAIAASSPSIASGDAFHLIRGRGIAVCQAFVERLNQTHFDADPFCGIPESDAVPGFELLSRRYLSAAEILPLYKYVHAFMYFGDQYHVDPNAEQETEIGKTLEQFVRFDWMHVWTYSPAADIDNDGMADNVLVWQGYGATDKGAHCGSVYDHKPWDFSFVEQRAFILKSDGKTIDEERTRAIFGTPVKSSPAGVDVAQTRNDRPFEPLADSLGIFRYNGTFYVEAYPKRASMNSASRLFVYQRKHRSTIKVCEIR